MQFNIPKDGSFRGLDTSSRSMFFSLAEWA